MGKLSVFGSSGFVGNAYIEAYGGIPIPRNSRISGSDDILYFISTVDNYNIHTNPHLDIDTNLTVLIDVLEEWRRSKPPAKSVFNYISSWFVYGQDCAHGQYSVTGVPETAPCDPKGFYSITKRAAEQLLISYCQTYDLNYRIMRLGNVLGAADKKVSAKKNALQYLIGEIKENRPINLYNMGRFYRDFIDVRDCVWAIDLVTRSGKPNEIYNIGNGKTMFNVPIFYAKYKLNSASAISNIPPKEFHNKVQPSTSFFMDTTKLNNLGYIPAYTIEQTVDDLISK